VTPVHVIPNATLRMRDAFWRALDLPVFAVEPAHMASAEFANKEVSGPEALCATRLALDPDRV